VHSEQWIDSLLKDLAGQSLDRHLRVWPQAGGKIEAGGRVYLNFSSNDYLDLANRSEVRQSVIKAVQDFGAGATASRLMSGTLTCHEQLEKRLAAFKGYAAALVFGSGWLTNAGVIPASWAGKTRSWPTNSFMRVFWMHPCSAGRSLSGSITMIPIT